MSMKKMAASRSVLECSLAITASLMAYMQHTAGAVGVVAGVDVAAAHALDPGDLLGLGLVAGPHQVAHPGAAGGQDALELQGRDHVGEVGVGVLQVHTGVEGLEPGG